LKAALETGAGGMGFLKCLIIVFIHPVRPHHEFFPMETGF
jgi:hypothetical protein